MTSTLFKNKRICQDNGIKIVRARLVYCSTIWVCLCVCNSKTSTENKRDDKKESTNDKSGLFEIKMKSLQLNVLVRLKPLHALWFSLVRPFFSRNKNRTHRLCIRLPTDVYCIYSVGCLKFKMQIFLSHALDRNVKTKTKTHTKHQ